MRSRTKTVALRPGYQNFQVAQLKTNSPQGARATENTIGMLGAAR